MPTCSKWRNCSGSTPGRLTSGLAPTYAGHLDMPHTSIAKVGYFTDIRLSNLTTPDPDLRAQPS